jgi:hypothetical protein
MIDLETLDTKGTAVVTALGAVFFDPYSKVIGEKLYRVTNDWAAQQRHGRTISGDTVRWWLEQDEMARTALTAPHDHVSVPTQVMLTDFTDFLDGYGGDIEVWGNGADFDNVILGSLYSDYGFKRPWSYSMNRCFRTMKSLPKSKHFIQPPRLGTHHNAIDDAVTQALYLQAIFEAQRKDK